jgi:hypothetical protein
MNRHIQEFARGGDAGNKEPNRWGQYGPGDDKRSHVDKNLL